MTVESDDRFFLKGRDAEAVGFPAEEGFIVEAGSIARKASVPSLSEYVLQARERLVSEQYSGRIRWTTEIHSKSHLQLTQWSCICGFGQGLQRMGRLETCRWSIT